LQEAKEAASQLAHASQSKSDWGCLFSRIFMNQGRCLSSEMLAGRLEVSLTGDTLGISPTTCFFIFLKLL
jgi:hypothetical protein